MTDKQPCLTHMMQAFHGRGGGSELPQSLRWLVELLMYLEAPLGVDVVIRPDGDRRRECKVHVTLRDREALLAIVGHMDDGNPGEAGQERCEERTAAPVSEGDLYSLELEILSMLRQETSPVLGKVVAARLRRLYSGWFRTCLARLVRLRFVIQERNGFRIARNEDAGDETGEGQSEPESALYTLELDILRVVGAAGRPIAGKVVAARLGRKYSGWIKTCLARLVKAGRLSQGGDGYGIMAGNEAGQERAAEGRAQEGEETSAQRPLYFDQVE